MGKATRRARGFTLIASLLMLVLLSGIAVGLMFLVNGSGRMGGNDLESNMAYYGAEAGMEKLTSDVLGLYQQKMAPTQSDFNTLATTSAPSSAQVGGMTYVESITASGNTGTTVLTTGNYAGLTAETIPLTLQVSAIRPTGATVNMTRGVEVALIPVFQFGAFSQSDLSMYPGPKFGFGGRIHTNGSLYLLADPGPTVLGDKVTVVNQILRDRLPNNYTSTTKYQGDVYVPNTAHGCDSYLTGSSGSPGSGCINMTSGASSTNNDASWSGGIPLSASPGNSNPNWTAQVGAHPPVSTGVFNGMIANAASTGVQTLTLPFVQGGSQTQSHDQIQIIRKALLNESTTSALGTSREYNKATIRVLLADTQADLHPERPALNDSNDVNLSPSASTYGLAIAVANAGTTRLAMAKVGKDTYWTAPPTGVSSYSGSNAWNLVNGWLRVEYLDKTSGNWVGITQQWLGYGFARGRLSPTAPAGSAGANTVHPDAILIFQQQADRDGNGAIPAPSGSPAGSAAGSGADAPYNIIDSGGCTTDTCSEYSWYPINLYDPREGYPVDGNASVYSPAISGTQCYVNGIMNAVELDVGNLALWLKGAAPYTAGAGQNVNFTNQNGYLLYFSDRRGMALDTNVTPNALTGEYGFEDTINSGSASGTPDGTLETATQGYNANIGFSPEDVDENNLLDRWGAANVGKGWGINTANNPYKAVDCKNSGRQNIVTGARHAIKLVDGGLTHLPLRLDYIQGTTTQSGGFTVASENPVYVQGDYNTNTSDAFWDPNVNAADPANHAAAAVIADSVTLLSNNWSDENSMLQPLSADGTCSTSTTGMCSRVATETFYRLAVAGGKSMNFPNNGNKDFGADGGLHNFLRFLEDWAHITAHYRGSIVSLYYSEYATGYFKCCSQVYSPPGRDFYFDQDFLTPANLPPGTPMLQDIENLSYWQNFKPCTTQSGGSCTN